MLRRENRPAETSSETMISKMVWQPYQPKVLWQAMYQEKPIMHVRTNKVTTYHPQQAPQRSNQMRPGTYQKPRNRSYDDSDVVYYNYDNKPMLPMQRMTLNRSYVKPLPPRGPLRDGFSYEFQHERDPQPQPHSKYMRRPPINPINDPRKEMPPPPPTRLPATRKTTPQSVQLPSRSNSESKPTRERVRSEPIVHRKIDKPIRKTETGLSGKTSVSKLTGNNEASSDSKTRLTKAKSHSVTVSKPSPIKRFSTVVIGKAKKISFGAYGEFSNSEAIRTLKPSQSVDASGPVKTESKKIVTFIPNEATIEECREALFQWATAKRIKDKSFAKNCLIHRLIPYNGLQYELETFSEQRGLLCSHKPYNESDPLDPVNPENEPVDVWTLPCKPSLLFQNEIKKINIPSTDVIRPCFNCNGSDGLKCLACQGLGTQTCPSCSGEKVKVSTNGGFVPCKTCFGKGLAPCRTCATKGTVVCEVCLGRKKLRYFLQLVVTFTNHIDKYIYFRESLDDMNLPETVRRALKSQLIFEEENLPVSPLQTADNTDLNDNSKRLIQSSVKQLTSEKWLKQRHRLINLSCIECHAESKGKSFSFWIYGKGKKVYCPDYE